MTAFAPPSSVGGLLNGLPGSDTFWGRYLEDNPQAGYQRWLDSQGQGGGQTAYEQWAQSQYGRLQRSYEGSLPNRPLDYSWVQFLQEQGPSLERQFQGLDPRQRGERYGYGTGRTRYIL